MTTIYSISISLTPHMYSTDKRQTEIATLNEAQSYILIDMGIIIVSQWT